MAETKKMNWKDAATASTDPKVKELFAKYNEAQDSDTAQSIQKEIIEILKATGITKESVLNTLTPVEPEEKKEPTKNPDPELTDAEKLKFWKDRIVVLESSRLKNETYAQRRELNKKIYEANEQIAKLREKIREAKRAKKLDEIKKSGRVSSLALKQAKVEHLIQKGFSLTNITKHPDGVKASELQKIIESNGFLGRIESKYHGFAAMWERWKAKFLK